VRCDELGVRKILYFPSILEYFFSIFV
jgi:hypothetical protein